MYIVLSLTVTVRVVSDRQSDCVDDSQPLSLLPKLREVAALLSLSHASAWESYALRLWPAGQPYPRLG